MQWAQVKVNEAMHGLICFVFGKNYNAFFFLLVLISREIKASANSLPDADSSTNAVGIGEGQSRYDWVYLFHFLIQITMYFFLCVY